MPLLVGVVLRLLLLLLLLLLAMADVPPSHDCSMVSRNSGALASDEYRNLLSKSCCFVVFVVLDVMKS